MGISLELYRARIGGFNCSRSKICTPCDPCDPIQVEHVPPHDPPIPIWNLTWKQSSLAIVFLVISALCHANFLLMSGIHPHPGPTSTASAPHSPQPLTREERQTDILARMIVEANDVAIKDVLRLYDPSMTLSKLKKSLNKSKVAPLIATMDFLGVKNADQDTKDIIIEKMVIRIQSLFPDNCSICNHDYVINRNDKPLLSCAKCSQGIHSRCLAQKLGIAEVELENMTQEDVLSTVNPYGLETMVYLCGYCHKEDFSYEESTPIKPRQVSNIAEAASHVDSDDTVAPKTSPTPPPNQPTDASATTTPHQMIDDSQDGGTDSDTDAETDNRSHRRHLTKTQPSSAKPSGSKPPDDKPKPTCSFYLRGQCRHGISGKGCSRSHPPFCRKLMAFGNKNPRGCTNGKECNKLHPKMCQHSLNTRECLDDKCTSYHVKGTRRRNSKPAESSSSTLHIDRKKTSHDQPQKPSSEPHFNPQEAFLEALNTWTKQFMTCLDHKLLAASQPAHPVATATNTQANLSTAVPHTAVLLPSGQLFHQNQGMNPQLLRY